MRLTKTQNFIQHTMLTYFFFKTEKISAHRSISSRPIIVTEIPGSPNKRHQTIKNRQIEDPRLKGRPPPEPLAPGSVAAVPKKTKSKAPEKVSRY